MRTFIDFAESLRTDVRINLSGDQAFVTQKFLDAPDIGPTIEQVGRKTVPQRVRTCALVETALFEIFFEHAPHTSRCQSIAEAIEKDCRGMLFGRVRIGLSLGEPIFNRFLSIRSERRKSFFATLSSYPDESCAEVDVFNREADQFAHAQTGRVHGFQNGAVTYSRSTAGRWAFEQAGNFFCRKEVG